MPTAPKGPIQMWADAALHRTEASLRQASRRWSAVLVVVSAEDALSLKDSLLHYYTSNGDHYADQFRAAIRATKQKYGEA